MLTDWTRGSWHTRWPLGHRAVHGLYPSQGLRGVSQQRTALCEFFLAHPIRQKAEVPYPVEAVRRDVQHQTLQKLHRVQCLGAEAVATLIILVAKGHVAVLQGHEPVVRDGDAMGIAGQVLEDVLRVLDGLFGIDDPLRVVQVCE